MITQVETIADADEDEEVLAARGFGTATDLGLQRRTVELSQYAVMARLDREIALSDKETELRKLSENSGIPFDKLEEEYNAWVAKGKPTGQVEARGRQIEEDVTAELLQSTEDSPARGDAASAENALRTRKEYIDKLNQFITGLGSFIFENEQELAKSLQAELPNYLKERFSGTSVDTKTFFIEQLFTELESRAKQEFPDTNWTHGASAWISALKYRWLREIGAPVVFSHIQLPEAKGYPDDKES